MFLEIFKFEIKYRAKRPDTYIYFFFILLFSMLSVNIVFEGGLDSLKRNAPYVITRAMTATSMFFIIIVSMIMGVAALRDFDHNMESLMFVNPIKKRDYLFGKFLGSFAVLTFVFSGLPLGMLVSDLIPWHQPDSLLPFNIWYYIQPFISIVLPTLFFSGAIFFVSGALSKKLMVVYTQGVFFLMIYIVVNQIMRNSDNLFIAALLEPFSFQTINIVTRYWTLTEQNSLFIPLNGLLLYNRLLWVSVGIIVFIFGYYRFSLKVMRGRSSKKSLKNNLNQEVKRTEVTDVQIPSFQNTPVKFGNLKKLWHHSLF